MDIKKILALAIVVLAVLSCMSVVSAGFFDFLGGGESNETYTFDGFTLDLPKDANITNDTYEEDGYVVKSYDIEWVDDSGKDVYITVSTSEGDLLVQSMDEYKANMESYGAKAEGNFSKWAVFHIDELPITELDDFNLTLSGYVLAQHFGSEMVSMSGDDLNVLKSVAETFKKT